jgi:hypothetical protein
MTYLAEHPWGYEGEFGLGIKTLIISLYYGGNISQGKLLEFLEDIDLLENFQLPTKLNGKTLSKYYLKKLC